MPCSAYLFWWYCLGWRRRQSWQQHEWEACLVCSNSLSVPRASMLLSRRRWRSCYCRWTRRGRNWGYDSTAALVTAACLTELLRLTKMCALSSSTLVTSFSAALQWMICCLPCSCYALSSMYVPSAAWRCYYYVVYSTSTLLLTVSGTGLVTSSGSKYLTAVY